ncbi:phosphatase 2C (PP2C)-like protein [Corchorus olitorius]|uniref:protein-serine/threonine phosphatase n=1 Tax=Corchorus olitorius TaxID=93759 RepID=A0A1R3HU88_9ROSI|nr:phosphatase 2C (PP2C)-like protein [Corchorus olitorius]
MHSAMDDDEPTYRGDKMSVKLSFNLTYLDPNATIKDFEMGSCCSSAKGKSGSQRDDQVTDASTATTTCTSPMKQKQRQGSGRWRKKSSGLVPMDEAELRLISGRMFLNGSSNVACLYTQQGKKGTNQDAMLVWENFSSRSDTIFCGVFDGHGPYGHMVAKKVRDSLPIKLCTQWRSSLAGEQSSLSKSESAPDSTLSEDAASMSMDDEFCEPLEVEENEQIPEMYLPLKQSMLKAFKLMDKELKLHPTIDCFCSGSTAVTLVKQGQHLVIGNVGDSRAVMAVRDKDNSLVAIQLTVDLKPDLPSLSLSLLHIREAARIQQCKGRVFALQDEPEVARVWLPNNDSPGLAMARAFGDFCLKDFGLISVPDIFYRHLTERDEFIILATDGVWDVLSNKEAIDIVASAPSRATAARALVDCATRAWRLKYPTSKNDDCAVVCLFLEHLSASNGAVEENDTTKLPHEYGDSIVGVGDDKIVSHAVSLMRSGTFESSTEIVPAPESTEERLSSKFPGQSRRSLAECISVTDDEEWSALEGITRVNSLLSLPSERIYRLQVASCEMQTSTLVMCNAGQQSVGL